MCIRDRVINNDENAPVAIIETPDALSCDSAFISLDASVNSSQGPNFTYSWSTNNGDFTNDATLEEITTRIAEAGTYQLTVFDQSNDCESTTTVEVTDSRRLPTLVLNKPTNDTLNCLVSSLQYFVNTNAEIPTYRWNLANNELSTSDTLLITAPGDYRLQIIDESNNCTTNERINITIDTIAPIAEAGAPQELNCLVGEVTLNGTQSSQGNQFSYIWTDEPGATIGTSMETTVSKEGLFRLTVVNTQTGCRRQDTVAVIAARDNPIARAGNDTVYCRGIENFELLIGSEATSQGSNFSYQWQIAGGDLLGNEIKQPIISEGIYVLNVVNKDNNCEAFDSITVTEAPRPQITIEESGGINCRDNLITYTARSDLPNTAIRWDGQEVFEDTVLRATDALAGATYVAFVVDETTGCENQSGFITILPDRNLPIVRPGVDGILNCQDTILLDGSLSQKGPQFQYTWTTETGNILSDADSLVAMADAPGTYTLSILNTDNFCTNSDTIQITDNRIAPEVSLAANAMLTCDNPTVNLGEEITTNSPTLFFTWRNQEGDVLGNRSVLSEITTPDTYIIEVIDSFNLCSTLDSTLVVENTEAPALELEAVQTLDCTNPTTTLSAATPTVDAEYEWTTLDGNILEGANTLNAVVNAEGTYRLTVANTENGCTSSDTIQVLDNQERPEIDAGNNTSITCYNDTLLQLNGSIQSDEAELLLEWTASIPDFAPISDSLRIVVNQPGTYFLKATNPTTACIQIDSVVVDLNTQAVAFMLNQDNPTIDCRSPELTIGSPILSDVTDLAYQWTTENGIIMGQDDAPEVVVGAAGAYTLAITNILNGCTSQDEVIIEAEGGLPTVSLGEDQLITCTNPQVQLGTENNSAGNNFEYEWTRDGVSINQVDRIISVEEAGTYQLTILNEDTGCEASETIQVTERNSIEGIEFPNPTSLDCRDSVQILSIAQADEAVADELSFEWRTLDGNFLGLPTNPTITVNRAGTYTISIRSNLSGCELEDSVAVLDNQILPNIALGDDQVLRCDQPSIELSSTLSNEQATLVYEWSDADNNIISRSATTTINKAGTYQLEITNEENGCVSADEIVIQQNDNLPQSAILSIASPACRDSRNASISIEQIIGGVAPYDIQLNGNASSNRAFENLSAGTYNLTIQDSLACQWDTLIAIDAPAALDIQINTSSDVLFTGDMISVSLEGNTPLSSIAFIDWQPADIFPCSDCAEQSVPLFNDTQIEVGVMDENGCEGFATAFVEVKLAEMPNAITPNGDGMNDELKIPAIEADPDGHPDNEIIIFNRWGDVVYKAAPYRNDWNGTQNGQSLPEGTYYYVIRLDVSEGATMKGIVTILK